MRYFQTPQQNLINVESPVNVDFYKSILDKAQQNLDQGTMMKNKYLEDVYNQKYINQEAHDVAISKAEGILQNSLNSPFVNPSKIGNDIVKAGRVIAPWKAANERQLGLIKQVEEYKQHFGANALTSNPADLKLLDDNGEFVRPEKLNVNLMNAGLIDDLINSHEKGFLTSETPETRVHSDIPFQIKLQTTKGLSETQKKQYYGEKGSKINDLADNALKSYPEILNIFNGDRDKAVAYIKPRIQSVVGQYGQSIDNKYVSNSWGEYLAKKSLEAKAPRGLDTPFSTTPSLVGVPNDISVGSMLNNLTGSTAAPFNWDTVPFNSKGNMMTFSTPKMSTDPSSYSSIKGKPVGNENYIKKFEQLSALKGWLTQHQIPFTSDKDALNKLKQSTENSKGLYGTKDENLAVNFMGNNIDPYYIGRGTEILNKKTGKWEEMPLEDIKDKTGLLKADKIKAAGVGSIEDQIRKNPNIHFDYTGSKTKSLKTILDANNEEQYIRYDIPNEQATQYSEPMRQVKQLPFSPGKHVISFPKDGLYAEVNVGPDYVTDGSGRSILGNKITNMRLVDNTPDARNAGLLRGLEKVKTTGEYENFMEDLAQRYRNYWFEHDDIIKKSVSDKK
jgi:hypothetical protein